MDVKDALVNKGYYFDRCIDLYFYNDKHELLATLKTPPRSFKPSITVKGEYIEGQYAISSYISIQNMAYDVDVNAVSFIECYMYYGGLLDSKEFSPDTYKVKGGHKISFSVLYCDQEKEPPNRAVRFQCTVAAQDRARYNYEVKTLPSGRLLTGWEYDKLPAAQRQTGTGGKNTIKKAYLIDILKDLAIAQNKDCELEAQGLDNIAKSSLKKSVMIQSIVCPKSLAKNDEKKVLLSGAANTVGDLIRELNSYATGFDGSKSYCEWVVAINGTTLNVTRLIPLNWRGMAVAEGYNTEEQQVQYYEKNFKSEDYEIYTGEGWKQKTSGLSQNSVVYLNYVKSAYRTETVVYCSTIYDDRIRPGCLCVIQGNAIMGRHSGKGGKSGSRLIHLTNKLVLFRVTGGVNFEFSTTEDSSMSFTGVVVDEDWQKNTEENKEKQE